MNPFDPISAASQALFRLGRSFSRLPAPSGERSSVLLVQAVAEGLAEGRTMSVKAVAEALGVEHSTASRLVTKARDEGYLEVLASRQDRRAVKLTLTPSGHALERESRLWQRQVFESLTQDWSEAERQAFAGQFLRFADALSRSLLADDVSEKR